MVVDQLPIFPGCEDMVDYSERKECADKKLLAYLFHHISYPPKGRAGDVEGLVVVKFGVDATGKVGEPELGRGVHTALDEEALRVARQMVQEHPVRMPATKEGEAVAYEFKLPIKFELATEV